MCQAGRCLCVLGAETHELGRQRSACIGVGAHVSGRQMPVRIGGGDP